MADIGLQWTQPVVHRIITILNVFKLLIWIHQQNCFEFILELAFKVINQEVLELQSF